MDGSVARTIRQVSTGLLVPEEGMRLRRYIGTPEIEQIDPILLLDWFESPAGAPSDEGFAPHPHRGFETITLMLSGGMEHRDNQGNFGVVGAGGAQVMRAGLGVLHAERPIPGDAGISGLQIWLNLPAAEKGLEPAYQAIASETVPEEHRTGARVRVISGKTASGTQGPMASRSTDPLLLEVYLTPGAVFEEPLPHPAKGFVLVVSGAVEMPGDEGMPQTLAAGALGRLGAGEHVRMRSEGDARVVLVAGRPIGEPVSRGGPFVMSTRQEVVQAFADYQAGRFGPPLSKA